ncbi:siderophore-interacting protein [Aeromicrobium sp. YIM 150415]|uniref:siderophore-interacting protein n=1 Tax=Aeromicrobium sp. YIM 150415 TaxID=2803912 RepID=UPI001966119D|nr:siderophore-interacting protein [Aeromicrobium sp. YIM 150415]MBM9463786.1 siderophore-interacting protein [Aeromicrobium sp. YIM 150415]
MSTTYVRATVAHVQRLTPAMIRITLRSDDLRDYEADGYPDDYCRVLFPHPGEREPVIPETVDGLQVTPAGRVDAPMRNYSIRRLDRDVREVDIDFVVHGRGIATNWAQRARPGDVLALGPAGGGYAPPAGVAWRHLAADITALPAASRVIEELSAGERLIASIVVPTPADEQRLVSAGDVELRWTHEPDPARVGAALLRAVEEFAAPAGEGYTWVCGENTACRLARRHLRHTLGLPADRYRTLGYWRLDDERWAARYREVADEVDQRIEEAGAAISDDERFMDEVERIYEEAGLGW